MTQGRSRQLWLFALAAGVAFVPLLFPPASNGITWDEAYYYPTFRDVAGWGGLLLGDPALALSGDGVRMGWERIHELPPVLKWLGALAVSLGPDGGWGVLSAMRVIPWLAHLGTLLLMTAVLRGRVTAPCAALAVIVYGLSPVVMGHARVAATESLFAFISVLVVWVGTRRWRRWPWLLALGAALGIALATKVNGIILIAAVVFWLLTRRTLGRRNWSGPRGPEVAAVAGILLLAPLVAFALWPWMWHDTGARIAEYYRFIREHSHQGVWFLGRKWNFGTDPAPWYFPLVMAHAKMPLAALGCFWVGIAAGLARLARTRRMHHTDYLLALCMLAPFVAASLPGAPKYDGVRLFFPMFAPAAMLAARGVFMAGRWLRRGGGLTESRRQAAVLLLAVAALTVRRPSIDYHNAAAAMLPGAVFPFEQTYWGGALNRDVVAWMSANLPAGARIKTLALQPDALAILREWGLLDDSAVIEGPPPYDVHILQNRRGFWSRTEWYFFHNREPLAVFGRGHGGEPLILIYDGRPPTLAELEAVSADPNLIAPPL